MSSTRGMPGVGERIVINGLRYEIVNAEPVHAQPGFTGGMWYYLRGAGQFFVESEDYHLYEVEQ